MNDNTAETKSLKFQLESVEETTPPEGAEKGKWYSYIIGRGKSVIKGKRCGTLKAVTEHAEGIVEDLNSRGSNYGSMYVSRRMQKSDDSK